MVVTLSWETQLKNIDSVSTSSSYFVGINICFFRSDGSWWAQCLTAVLEPEWLSVRLMSARSGTSARAPATWPTACDRQPTYYQVTDCQDTFTSDHCTSTRHNAHGRWRSGFAQQLYYCYHRLNTSLKQIKADVQFAHSDGGILGRFYWLEMHIWQIWSLLWQNVTYKTFFWLLLVLIAISDVVFCTVCSSVWLPCCSSEFYFLRENSSWAFYLILACWEWEASLCLKLRV